jgi:O-antigen ligase
MQGVYFQKFDSSVLYFLPLMLLLATDPLFYPFPHVPNNQYVGFGSIYVGIVNSLVKFAGPAAAVYVILNINKYNKGLLIATLLFITFLIILVFESLYLYNSFFQYPHVILKVFNLFVALGLFAFYVGRRSLNFSALIPFIMLGLLLQIALRPEMLSLQSFVSHERGLPAQSVLLLCLPCVYFFNKYLISIKPVDLLKFLFVIVFILLANHRSVWATVAFSLLLSIIIIRKNINFKIAKVLSSLLMVTIIAGFVLSIAITYSSEVEEKIIRNITNILNPTEDRTGSWRLEQMESYWPMVESNFLAGMRWKGFELPVQFYHAEAGVALFADNTGHHFHSFYFDILFYFGISGLLLYFITMIWPVTTLLRHNLKLNNLSLSFFIFSLSGLMYGLAYNLPFSYWLIFGVTIVLVNRELKDSQSGTKESISK